MPRLTFPFIVLALSLIAAIEVEAQAKINTPLSLVQCQPASLSWTDAQPPVYISVVQGTNTAGNALKQFPIQNSPAGDVRWSAVDIPAGTTITMLINDATGVNNFSGQVTIKDGSSDCHPSLTPDSSGAPSNNTTAGTTTSGSTSSGTTGSTGSTGSSGSGSSGSSGHTATTTSSTAPTHNSTLSSTSPSSASSTHGSTSTSGSTTSGGAGMSSASNTVVVGAAAAMVGVLLATGLF